MAKPNHYESVLKKTSDLTPYAQNSRTHSSEQINQIAFSVEEFGFTNPILIDEQNKIIAGHCRALAASKLGLDEVPCIILEGLTEVQKKAYVIADNSLALNAEWDLPMLQLEVDSLISNDFDINILGLDLSLLDDFDEQEGDSEAVDFSDSYESRLSVMCECKTEAEQQKVFDMLSKKGYECKILSM